jgi:hypothetical protein
MYLGLDLSLMALALRRAGGFSPVSLFANGEQGVFYDISDTATLFQDSAGTTPVTAVEQPVGLILDKSGRGNHASQSDSAKRPLWSSRVNLLTYSEQFDNAVWSKSNLTVSADAVAAPDGTVTADELIDDSTSGYHRLFRNIVNVPGVANTISVYAKNNNARYFCISSHTAASVYGYAMFDLQDGVVVASGALGTTYAVSGVSISAPDAGGWRRCAVTISNSAVSGALEIDFSLSDNGAITDRGMKSYSGTGKSVYIWGADLRVANESSALPPYQRVVTATDYDTTGFPAYLRFDNDALVTNSIDFTATDEMSVFAGVRKLSASGRAMLLELSATAANSGAFNIAAPESADDYSFGLTGNAGSPYYQPAGYGAPVTNLLSVGFDYAGAARAEEIIPSVNAALAQSGGAGTAAGTNTGFLNAALNIGSRNNASLFFNGRLFSLVVLGRGVTPTELTQTEGYVESKTFGKDMNYVLYEPILETLPSGDQITLTAGGDDLFVYQNYE